MTRRGRAARALALVALLVATGCGADDGIPFRPTPTSVAVATLRADVVTTLPHDTSSFTEGLEIGGDVRYESSGLYGTSTVQALERATGAVRATFALPASFFAEGLTKVGDRVLVLTWKERTAFVLDAATPTLTWDLGAPYELRALLLLSLIHISEPTRPY